MKRWALVFAGLTAALSIALLATQRENRRLREAIDVLVRDKARAARLEPGQNLRAFTLNDAQGVPTRFDFSGASVGTVFLIQAAACDSCERTRPLWQHALALAARPDVRVLCVQTDALDGKPAALEGLPPAYAVPLPPEGWLADLPAVPATLVADENGVLAHAWFTELDANSAQELATAITTLGAHGDVPK